jgi:hypothetical protein
MPAPRSKPDMSRAVMNLRDRMMEIQNDFDRMVSGFGEQGVGFAVLEARAFLQKAISAIDENQPHKAKAKSDLD